MDPGAQGMTHISFKLTVRSWSIDHVNCKIYARGAFGKFVAWSVIVVRDIIGIPINHDMV